jgi:mannose-6-phosphate isomerase
MPLYPLRFEPIYQYRLWGGRRLSGLLSAPLPGDGPIGEAWVLSDRDDHQSQVANGPLKGQTIGRLMEQYRTQLMGKLGPRFHRFPLLLKFLDASEMLSVQVHPSDAYPVLIPAGDTGKTEAWVVIEAERESQIYAGLKPDTTADGLRRSLENGTIADHLAAIVPKPGDAIFIPAGTVHTLGGDIVVFEVQQNSDVTCIDFEGSAFGLVAPRVETTTPVERERIFDCEPFRLWRLLGQAPFPVGAAAEPRVVVCIAGSGQVEHGNTPYAVGKGDVWLLPAEAGVCTFRPSQEVTLLEIAIHGS